MSRREGRPEREAKLPKILYIAGYGRSGSTVLSTLLGNHPSIASLGEVAFLFEDWSEPERVCACGSPYPKCDFWQDLFPEPGEAKTVARHTRRVERFRALPRLWRSGGSGKRNQQYRAAQRRVFHHATWRAAKPVVVDTSKSAWATAGRALALSKFAGLDVMVLHLVRSGRSTLESLLLVGSNWELEGHRPPRRFPAIRATAGWVSANLCATAVRRRLGEEHYLLLRYEDLISDPEGSLQRIGDFLQPDMMTSLMCQVRAGGAFAVGHVVGGNRVRFSGRIQLGKTTVRRGGRQVSLLHRLPFALFGTWLDRIYGYRGRREVTGPVS